MISSLAMQSTILNQYSLATSNMMHVSELRNRLASQYNSFGMSQPLRPIAQLDKAFDLQSMADNTRITVYDKLMEALNKKLANDVKKSTPHYSGLNYLA